MGWIRDFPCFGYFTCIVKIILLKSKKFYLHPRILYFNYEETTNLLMNTKAFLVLVLSIGWIWFCQHWHCCWINQYCLVSTLETEVTASVDPTRNDPLNFNWSKSDPIITDLLLRPYLANIFNGMTNDNILEITGKYFKDEAVPEGFENMGMARASTIRSLIADRITGERVRLKSQQVKETDGVREYEFVSHSFNWIMPEVDKPEVVELTDKTIILFPFNSASNKMYPELDHYLSDLAIHLKSSNEVVHLTGHTDGIGKVIYNERLGMKRAKKISRILIKKGVKRAQIKTYSKGMLEPVATNNTDEGRTQNRRVVVQIE